jgi:hypothetical protein
MNLRSVVAEGLGTCYDKTKTVANVAARNRRLTPGVVEKKYEYDNEHYPTWCAPRLIHVQKAWIAPSGSRARLLIEKSVPSKQLATLNDNSRVLTFATDFAGYTEGQKALHIKLDYCKAPINPVANEINIELEFEDGGSKQSVLEIKYDYKLLDKIKYGDQDHEAGTHEWKLTQEDPIEASTAIPTCFKDWPNCVPIPDSALRYYWNPLICPGYSPCALFSLLRRIEKRAKTDLARYACIKGNDKQQIEFHILTSVCTQDGAPTILPSDTISGKDADWLRFPSKDISIRNIPNTSEFLVCWINKDSNKVCNQVAWIGYSTESA